MALQPLIPAELTICDCWKFDELSQTGYGCGFKTGPTSPESNMEPQNGFAKLGHLSDPILRVPWFHGSMWNFVHKQRPLMCNHRAVVTPRFKTLEWFCPQKCNCPGQGASTGLGGELFMVELAKKYARNSTKMIGLSGGEVKWYRGK